MSDQQQGQLPALTSLRFIAAFAVLLLHYRDLLGPLPDGVFRAIVGGQYGVTFFFILSGFILTYRYHDWFAGGVTDGRYWRFQRYRIARIYPVYILGLLLDTPWHLLERAQAGQLGDGRPDMVGVMAAEPGRASGLGAGGAVRDVLEHAGVECRGGVLLLSDLSIPMRRAAAPAAARHGARRAAARDGRARHRHLCRGDLVAAVRGARGA